MPRQWKAIRMRLSTWIIFNSTVTRSLNSMTSKCVCDSQASRLCCAWENNVNDELFLLACSEITSSYIYMLMECGHLDLNTWLRNRKSVNPLDRKCYWRNMLEAVHTIHKHGDHHLSHSLNHHFYYFSYFSTKHSGLFALGWAIHSILQISSPYLWQYNSLNKFQHNNNHKEMTLHNR